MAQRRARAHPFDLALEVRLLLVLILKLAQLRRELRLLLLEPAVGLAVDLGDALRLGLGAEHELAQLSPRRRVVHLQGLGLLEILFAHLGGLEQSVDGTFELGSRLGDVSECISVHIGSIYFAASLGWKPCLTTRPEEGC